ncbi:MAG: cell division topological specificity factor MinE [Clostridia bacterium]|nr:cell division topological specificity factor MinE [Clostridia bacterium]
MFENILKFFKKAKNEDKKITDSKSAAKERLQLVLMQDRANVSADFLDLMRHEIIEVIKKYIDVDEKSIDVRLTNIENEDGTNGAPALYANIPILNIKNEARKVDSSKIKEIREEKKEEDDMAKDKEKDEAKKPEEKEAENKEENKKEEKEDTAKEEIKEEEKNENEEDSNKEEDSEQSEKEELTTENK